MDKFQGKLILITGASSGIGRQTALDLAKLGANLILVARREEPLHDLAQIIQAQGREVLIAPCDLADASARERLIQQVLSQTGAPDVLINNAGYGNYRPFREETPTEIARLMEVNYTAAAHLISAFLPGMLKRGSGAIVNVASGAGRVALPNMAGYCAAKFALCALSDALALELIGTGITLHLINPGPVATEFFDAGGWKGKKPERPATAEQVSQAILRALRTKRREIFVPAKRAWLVYVFNLLGPLGRWALARRAH